MGGYWSTQKIDPSYVKNQNIIVTGGNSGIGYYTCLHLAKNGANVTLLARDEKRGCQAIKTLKEKAPEAQLELAVCDISNLSSVRNFASKYLEKNVPLDCLVNNAGIMAPPKRLESADGFELQLATNHLGHFALTGLLMPALQKSESARVVSVSSLMAQMGSWDKENIDFVRENEAKYKGMKVYSDSKLANLLFTNELGIRYPNIVSVAAHPGAASTNLQKHQFGWARFVMQSSEQGSFPTLRAATEQGLESSTYFGPRWIYIYGCPQKVVFPSLVGNLDLCSAFWKASVEATKVDY